MIEAAVWPEALAGWEQDDHGACRGQSYVLVRIEKEAVRRNRAALRPRPPEKAAPDDRLDRLMARLESIERKPKDAPQPVVVNNNITIPAPPPADSSGGDMKYLVLAAIFLAFITPPPPEPDPVRRADYRNALQPSARGSVAIGQFRYKIFGRLAQGDSCDVFLGERDAALSERVVLKVLRAGGDEDLLRREHETLQALPRSAAQGTPYFAQRIPAVVALGRAVSPGDPLALVLRHQSGFIETLEDVAAAFPQGLDARHGVWIWRRVLEVLAWVHGSAYVHGAILPRHLLVNSRDHGVLLLGWSCAGRLGSPPSARLDLRMAARCVAYALSGAGDRMPDGLPRPLAELLGPYLDDSSAVATENAFKLHELVGQAAREAYGPPRFLPLATPAWKDVVAPGG